MDLLTRIEASLEFMDDGGPIRVDVVNLREVLEGAREALLKLETRETELADLEQEAERLRSKLDRYRAALERIIEAWDGDAEDMTEDPAVIAEEALSDG